MPTPDLILHQYEVSPFSEKVRVALGIKQLPWCGCNQPAIMPKPDLIALTGGYRRIPVLQIGADLFFDSQFIIDELERLAPEVSVFAGCGEGLAGALAQWSDGPVFQAIVGLLFSGEWQVDQAFLDDRSAMIGQPFDPAAMAAAAPQLRADLRGHLQLLERQLAEGPFLMGERPNAVDAAAFHPLRFAQWGEGPTAALIADFPAVSAWLQRVVDLGHGPRGDDVPGADAIALAARSQPRPAGASMPLAGDPQPGQRVSVKYHDANTPRLTGRLTEITPGHVAIAPDPALAAGEVVLHMPRTVAAVTAD